MPLTNTTCKQAKPKDKDYKLSDEKGLYLLITRKGSKYWRFKYRYAQKEKVLALGVYPEISLKDARTKIYSARKLLLEGIDPGVAKKAKKLSILQANANSFEVIAWEWFSKEEDSWSPAHIKKQKGLLEKNLIPYLGALPVSEISPIILLDCLKKAEARGVLETGRAERDPSADLKGALKTPQVRRFSAITEPKKLGQLLRAIEGFEGTPTVATALKLVPMLLVRPGKLRQMKWCEINFSDKEWRIPTD